MFYERSYMTANTTLENKQQENNNNRQIILQGHRASTEIHTMKQKATDASSEIRRVLTHSLWLVESCHVGRGLEVTWQLSTNEKFI